MRDPEADYAKLFPPPRHVEKQILGAQQKPGLADHLTTAQKPRSDASVFSVLPNRFADKTLDATGRGENPGCDQYQAKLHQIFARPCPGQNPFTFPHGEKIPFNKTNRRVLTKCFAERDEPIFMPADDRCQFFNNQHMRNPMVAKRRISGKPHAQAADDNRQRALMPDHAKPLMCQRYFRRGE